MNQEEKIMNLEYNLICDFIKLRNELGLTQKQMAEEAKVAPAPAASAAKAKSGVRAKNTNPGKKTNPKKGKK